MPKLRLLLIVLCVILTGSISFAQSFWGATQHGMSEPEVRAVVPDATPPSDPATLHSGALELLRLNRVELAQETFAGRFYFLAGKLHQVTLSLEGATRERMSGAFDSVAKELRAKYGREMSISTSDVNGDRKATWMSKNTRICEL